MLRAEYQLEIVTPLFLGGANPRGNPELRASSFRGAMRFWLRALLGGVLGDDPQKIFEYESKVFGSTENGSPVIIRVEHPNLNPRSYISYSQLTQNKEGLSYLFFSARGTRSQNERQAISPGQSFKVTLQLKHGIQDSLPLETAHASLWLLTHFGGIGSRSRRGGGNLQVRSVDINGNMSSSLPSFGIKAKTPEELQKELTDKLSSLHNWAVENFNNLKSVELKEQPNFDVLHNRCCRIWIINESYNNWSDALNALGQVMKSFRQRYMPDYANVKSVIQGQGSLEPVKRAAFGLPIVFYFRSLNNKRETLTGETHERQASPLIIRIIKLANDRFTPLLLRFYRPILPKDEKLKLQTKLTQQPNSQILDEFLERVGVELGQLLEVREW